MSQAGAFIIWIVSMIIIALIMGDDGVWIVLLLGFILFLTTKDNVA